MVFGPYTLSGRLNPNKRYPDRYASTEALSPIVRAELIALIQAGCTEITLDEPSMSCSAYKEDPRRFVEIFNRTVAPVVGKCRLSTHLCYSNFKSRAVGPRQYAPMFPDFPEQYAPPERLAFAPDCGLSHTARWAAKLKLKNMVTGVKIVRADLGL